MHFREHCWRAAALRRAREITKRASNGRMNGIATTRAVFVGIFPYYFCSRFNREGNGIRRQFSPCFLPTMSLLVLPYPPSYRVVAEKTDVYGSSESGVGDAILLYIVNLSRF